MATMFDCSSKSSNKEVYDEIKKLFEETYQCIDKALQFDERGNTAEATNMYEFSLSLLDQALSIPLESPAQPDVEWEKAYSHVQKMRKTKKEVLSRIADAQRREETTTEIAPPSYEEAVGTSGFSRPTPGPSAPAVTSAPPPPYIPCEAFVDAANNTSDGKASQYSDLHVQLEEMRVQSNREILYSHNNVRVYFIAPDGRVSATSQPDTLIIGRIEDLTADDVLDDTLLGIVNDLSGGEEKKHHRRHRGHSRHLSSSSRHRRSHERRVPQGSGGQVYLQVGTWVYPLFPGVSPVFRSAYGAFILPDVHSDLPGASVGIILPETADQSVYDVLNSILCGVVGSEDIPGRDRDTHSRVRRSDRSERKSGFSQNVIRGASYIANNLVRGAGSASRFLDSTTPHLMNKMTPAPEPQPVNPALKTTLGVAKNVSGNVAGVSDFLADKVSSAASSLGSYLGPYVQRGGTRLLSLTTKMNQQEAASKVNTVMDATASTVEGIATVYMGLEGAASILARSLSNNTVQIIRHKYGQPAGDTANDAMAVGGNVYTIHGNYKLLRPTKVAKTVAKGAVKGASSSMAEPEGPHSEFSGEGPGAGGGFSSYSSDASLPPKQ